MERTYVIGAVIAGLVGLVALFAPRRAAAESRDARGQPAGGTATVTPLPPRQPELDFEMPPNPPRGIRNNNPGNIEAGNIPWRGLVGRDGRYSVFATPQDGIRAMALEIWDAIVNDKMTTLRRFIGDSVHGWAPEPENDSAAYIADVSKRSGLDPDEPLQYRRDVTALIKGIIWHENGVQPYSEQLIAAGIAAAGK